MHGMRAAKAAHETTRLRLACLRRAADIACSPIVRRPRGPALMSQVWRASHAPTRFGRRASCALPSTPSCTRRRLRDTVTTQCIAGVRASSHKGISPVENPNCSSTSWYRSRARPILLPYHLCRRKDLTRRPDDLVNIMTLQVLPRCVATIPFPRKWYGGTGIVELRHSPGRSHRDSVHSRTVSLPYACIHFYRSA